jgi:hypothetical protein
MFFNIDFLMNIKNGLKTEDKYGKTDASGLHGISPRRLLQV